ncbi:hypothetical protein P278_32810 [Zhouia amylolytica AD3]|uniref:DoxX family protein n=2 Tax=Zhouia amylolytica TaxID=376730 RepID=W2UKA0_9FLAO|nr:hypothetical protein P278_32810 [Zhouia amylolytica AD3]
MYGFFYVNSYISRIILVEFLIHCAIINLFIMAQTTTFTPNWSFSKKLYFRLSFCYLALYIIPFPLGNLPFSNYPYMAVFNFWKWITTLVAENIFHIQNFKILFNGSGDKTSDYIKLLSIAGLALIITFFWSILDRKRNNYNKLLQFFLVALRYYLAYYMLSYGMSKLFTNQFSSLSLFDLVKTYGQSSPMGLMWNFMEYSDTYTIFSGISEIIGGVLLLFRRTTKLGALITFGVMLNVFLMNVSYDIPVKLFSFHLMLIAFYILIPHLKSLINYFLLNKPIPPVQYDKYFSKRRWNITALIFKILFITYTVVKFSIKQVEQQKQYGKFAALPALYGIYEVDKFTYNNNERLPLTTDSIRWKKLIIDKNSSLIINMDDTPKGVRHLVDSSNNALELTPYKKEMNYYYKFKYSKQDSILNLEGTYYQDTLKIRLIKQDHTQFPLLKRGFNWINEYPFNR